MWVFLITILSGLAAWYYIDARFGHLFNRVTSTQKASFQARVQKAVQQTRLIYHQIPKYDLQERHLSENVLKYTLMTALHNEFGSDASIQVEYVLPNYKRVDLVIMGPNQQTMAIEVKYIGAADLIAQKDMAEAQLEREPFWRWAKYLDTQCNTLAATPLNDLANHYPMIRDKLAHAQQQLDSYCDLLRKDSLFSNLATMVVVGAGRTIITG